MKYILCLILALADLWLCLLCLVMIGLIPIMELNDAGKFPLCVYAWKELS